MHVYPASVCYRNASGKNVELVCNKQYNSAAASDKLGKFSYRTEHQMFSVILLQKDLRLLVVKISTAHFTAQPMQMYTLYKSFG
jgi:hypothetical protein